MYLSCKKLSFICLSVSVSNHLYQRSSSLGFVWPAILYVSMRLANWSSKTTLNSGKSNTKFELARQKSLLQQTRLAYVLYECRNSILKCDTLQPNLHLFVFVSGSRIGIWVLIIATHLDSRDTKQVETTSEVMRQETYNTHSHARSTIPPLRASLEQR